MNESQAWLASINSDPEKKTWVKEFWDAVDDYKWSVTRSCVGTERARKRMDHATDQLIAMGVFPPEKHHPMPTLDELEGRVEYSVRNRR